MNFLKDLKDYDKDSIHVSTAYILLFCILAERCKVRLLSWRCLSSVVCRRFWHEFIVTKRLQVGSSGFNGKVDKCPNV